MNWDAIAADLSAHAWVYASMPFVAAAIGYGTKLVAIRMMFEPVEWAGIAGTPIGWQGIIPRHAGRMAEIAVDTLTRKLLSVREIFERLDPERLAREIEAPMLAAVEDVTREVLAQHQPGLWEMLPTFVRDRILKRVRAEAPATVREIMEDVRGRIEQLFDLKHMVVTNLTHDKHLLNRIFREVGREEFRFIARSGIWFGFVLGVVQMTVWLFYKSPWILPAFGLFVGFATDWVALKMLFNPKQPRRILGFTWQGLFLKRQQEVSRDYAALIATELLTPRKLWDAILTGPSSDKLIRLVERHVQQMVDGQAGVVRPLVAFSVGTRRYQEMKQAIAAKLMAHLPATLQHASDYAEDAMDIRGTLVAKMQALSPEEFEGLLRPAFQQDEWILISVGAALGFLVGEMQVLLMTH